MSRRQILIKIQNPKAKKFNIKKNFVNCFNEKMKNFGIVCLHFNTN